MIARVRWSARDDYFTEAKEGVTMDLKYRICGITVALAMLGTMPAHAGAAGMRAGSQSGTNLSLLFALPPRPPKPVRRRQLAMLLWHHRIAASGAAHRR